MGNSSSQPLTISSFDPERYQGKWWEIARYPNPFEIGCVRSTARYRWDASTQKMKVTNQCISKDDKVKEISGFATIPNPEYPGRLMVTFPVLKSVPSMNQANYWIHWTDYDRYAIVGNGNRSQLWILSREKSISQADFELLLLSVKGLGYDPSRLTVSTGALNGPSCDDYPKIPKNNKSDVKESLQYYEDHHSSSEDSSFWSESENPSKYHGGYKNKSNYESGFTNHK